MEPCAPGHPSGCPTAALRRVITRNNAARTSGATFLLLPGPSPEPATRMTARPRGLHQLDVQLPQPAHRTPPAADPARAGRPQPSGSSTRAGPSPRTSGGSVILRTADCRMPGRTPAHRGTRRLRRAVAGCRVPLVCRRQYAPRLLTALGGQEPRAWVMPSEGGDRRIPAPQGHRCRTGVAVRVRGGGSPW